jgi:ribonuclease-3
MNIIKKIFTKPFLEDGILIYSNNFRFSPKNLDHFRKAFTHRSTSKLNAEGPINYERLEFLGDAMLSSVIAAHLFNKAPQGDEGYLTKMRSKLSVENT